MTNRKPKKIYDVDVSIRKVGNGYLVKSSGWSEAFKESEVHNKELVYLDKEEAVQSALSLISAFSKDLV